MSDTVISPYTRLAGAARALITSASDMASAVQVHADAHEARLNSMREKIEQEADIADGIARQNSTL